MIWYIIVGIITLIAVVLIVTSIWEIDATKHYRYDPEGKERRETEDLDEWKTNLNVISQALKENYPEEWERLIKYYKERDNADPEDKARKELRYRYLPCKIRYERKLQVDSYWYEKARAIAGYIVGGVCLIALGVMIGTNVSTKMKWSVQEQTVKYEEEIVSLENNKQYIVTYYTSGVTKDIDISSTNIPAVIKEHNAQVKDLLTKIKVDRVNLNNPWISPWVNPACKNVDLLRVEATYINTLA